MADNILESYFVKVGALPDMASFSALGKQLVKTGASITTFSEETVKEIYKLDLAAITAFTAMGVGLVKLADKTAQADQAYRLFGLRMLMNKDVARAMQMALDNLGATIDEVAYDPELNARFKFLYERNIQLGKTLGITFDDTTKRIRDFRMQFKMFSDEFEVGVWATVTKLFEKLGYNQEGVLKKLQNLNDWIMRNLPEWSDKLSTRFIPLWQDVESVVKNLQHDFELLGEGFIHFTGEMRGDTSLTNAKLNFDTLAQATQEWVDLLDKAVLDISFITRWALHGYRGIGETVHGVLRTIAPWDWGSEGWKQTKEVFANAGQNFEGMAQDFSYGWFGLGAPKDAQDLIKFNETLKTRKTWQERSGAIKPSDEQMKDLFGVLTQKFNDVPPELIAGVIKEESGGNIFAQPRDKYGNLLSSAKGLMQLTDATAARFGVTNPFDPMENVAGGTAYLHTLLNMYGGNLPKAVMGFHEGEGGMEEWAKLNQILIQLHTEGKTPGMDADLDRALGAAQGLRVRGSFKRSGQIIDAFKDYEDRLNELYGEEQSGTMPFPDIPAGRVAQAYAARVMRDFQSAKAQGDSSGTYSVIINGLNIHVPKDLPEEQWGEFVQNKIFEANAMKSKMTQAQVAGGAHR